MPDGQSTGFLNDIGDTIGKSAAGAFGGSVPVTVNLSPWFYLAAVLALGVAAAIVFLQPRASA